MGALGWLLRAACAATWTWAVLLAGALLGAALTSRAAERRAKAAWRAAALQRITDASAADLKRILGTELPPWVRDSDFQKARASCRNRITRLGTHAPRIAAPAPSRRRG